MNKPTLQEFPLRLNNQIDYSNVFSYDIYKVSVNYYVLRSQKENNS